jgi:hypothetical protein
MTNIYWLNPESGVSTESEAETFTELFSDISAPGLQWSIGVQIYGESAVLWGPLLSGNGTGPLHFIYHGRTWAATR